jgi:uncharacterized protein YdeI (YjbR/CyaY-like superfamily)
VDAGGAAAILAASGEVAMIATERFERVEVASRDDLRRWLSENHGRKEGVWLVRYKAGVPEKHVGRLAVLDELIAWGWVDGILRKLDDARTMQLITPRREEAWAASYKVRAERLEAEGRMEAPGREAIARSKALGRWETYAAVDALEVPDDLRAALDAEPAAAVFFDRAAPSYRRNVLRWLFKAKRAETRDRRIADIVARSARGEKVPQM